MTKILILCLYYRYYEGTSIKSKVFFSLVWFCVLRLETQNSKGPFNAQKETSSIHLYICNSKAHQGLVKRGGRFPINSGFVNARRFIISAFEESNLLLFLKKMIRTSATTRCHVRRSDMYARRFIISAFEESNLLLFLKNDKDVSYYSVSRAQEWHVPSAVDSQTSYEQIKTKLVSNTIKKKSVPNKIVYKKVFRDQVSFFNPPSIHLASKRLQQKKHIMFLKNALHY